MPSTSSLFNRAAQATRQLFVDYPGIVTPVSNVVANVLLGFVFPQASAAFFMQEPGWFLNNVYLKERKAKLKAAGVDPTAQDEASLIAIAAVDESLSPTAQFGRRWGKKWGGTWALAGAALFSYYAHKNQMGHWPVLIASNLPGAGQSLSAIFENQAHSVAHWLQHFENPVSRSVQRRLNTAMVTFTLPEFLFGSGLFAATSAIDHEWKLLAAAMCLMVGDLGLLLQDSTLQEEIIVAEEENHVAIPDSTVVNGHGSQPE